MSMQTDTDQLTDVVCLIWSEATHQSLFRHHRAFFITITRIDKDYQSHTESSNESASRCRWWYSRNQFFVPKVCFKGLFASHFKNENGASSSWDVGFENESKLILNSRLRWLTQDIGLMRPARVTPIYRSGLWRFPFLQATSPRLLVLSQSMGQSLYLLSLYADR